MKKQGLKILGTSLLSALGLLAMLTSTAQAVELTNAQFFENGSLLEGEKTLVGSLGEREFLTAAGIKIYCEGGTEKAKIKNTAGEGTIQGQILFSGCEVLESPFCEIYENLANWEAEKDEGTFLVSSQGKIFFHGNQLYVLLSGLGEDQLFTDFGFAGPLCALPTFDEGQHMVVTGNTVLGFPSGSLNQKQHTFEVLAPELSSLFPDDHLLFGDESAHFAAGATTTISLSNGANWSAK